MSDTDASPQESTVARIVVGVDGSPHSIAALERAAEEARTRGGVLDVVTSWNFPPLMTGYELTFSPSFREIAETEQARSLAEVFGEEVPSWVNAVIAEGNAARTIIARSEGAELVVVGSRGHGGFAGLLLGSVSREVAAHSECPVLIMRRRRP